MKILGERYAVSLRYGTSTLYVVDWVAGVPLLEKEKPRPMRYFPEEIVEAIKRDPTIPSSRIHLEEPAPLVDRKEDDTLTLDDILGGL